MIRSKLVIIVDDDQSLLVILNYWFKAKEKIVKTFETGESALKFLLEEENLTNVSLIVLDRMLPDMDGLQILEKFEKLNSKIPPVLILSKLSTNKDILKGLNLGAVDYVTKPFNHEVFMQKALKLME
jgi:two-component system sensor histidine kinase/response regulator